MSNFDALQTLLTEILDETGKVSNDTELLLNKLRNVPVGGLTPEQQASLNEAVATATTIRDRLKALDARVPEEVPAPSPNPPPADGDHPAKS